MFYFKSINWYNNRNIAYLITHISMGKEDALHCLIEYVLRLNTLLYSCTRVLAA